MNRGFLPRHDFFGVDDEDHNQQQKDLQDQHEILSRKHGVDPYPMHPVQKAWDEEDSLLDWEPMVNKDTEKTIARAVQKAKDVKYVVALGMVRRLHNDPEIQKEHEPLRATEKYSDFLTRKAIEALT